MRPGGNMIAGSRDKMIFAYGFLEGGLALWVSLRFALA
jgi:hypothetical protein